MWNPYGRQEQWFQFAVSAKALGGSAWELAALPEPKRTYWFHRGLLLARAESEAFDISHPKKD